MKYLFTGFQDNTNSSKQIAKQLGKLFNDSEVLILTNHFETCVKQLYTMLQSNHFEFIIMFGQKPVIKDKVYLEKCAKVNEHILVTDFDTTDFAKCLAMHDCFTKESDNAGTSFCNWIYYHAMKYVQEHDLHTKVLFIHIPVLRNVTDFNKLVSDIHQALS